MKFMIKQHPRSAINVRESYKKEYICFLYIQVYRKQLFRSMLYASFGIFQPW